jgi:hypothetical protein
MACLVTLTPRRFLPTSADRTRPASALSPIGTPHGRFTRIKLARPFTLLQPLNFRALPVVFPPSPNVSDSSPSQNRCLRYSLSDLNVNTQGRTAEPGLAMGRASTGRNARSEASMEPRVRRRYRRYPGSAAAHWAAVTRRLWRRSRPRPPPGLPGLAAPPPSRRPRGDHCHGRKRCRSPRGRDLRRRSYRDAPGGGGRPSGPRRPGRRWFLQCVC